MNLENIRPIQSEDLSLSNLQLRSVNKQSDNSELLQKCLSIRKILFDQNKAQSQRAPVELGRFSFQDRLVKARNKMDSVEKPQDYVPQNRPKQNDNNGCDTLSVEGIKKMQSQIANFPQKKFENLPDNYINDLQELAQIINYIIKIQ